MTATEQPRRLHPQYKDELFRALNASPFLAHLEIKITGLDYGTSTFSMSPRAFRMQPFQVAHGGNVATLIDSATFWSCFLAMGSAEDGLTSVDLKLNYLAPARNEALTCVATMKKSGRTLSYADAEVRTDDGRLIAHGCSTLMRVKGLSLALPVPMFL